MIKVLKEHEVLLQWYELVSIEEEFRNVSEHTMYPYIIKLTDNAASRGIALAHGAKELIGVYVYSKEQSYSGQVIVEEHMVRPEVLLFEYLIYFEQHRVEENRWKNKT